MMRLTNYRLCTYGMALCLAVSTALSNTALAAGEKPEGYTARLFVLPIEDTPLSRGITLYKEGKYEDALEQLQKAVAANPNDALTNLWLGLALEGNKKPYEAMAAWRKCYGNSKWEPIADYLKALSWWKLGNTNDAINYLNDALVNLKDSKPVDFKPAKEAMQQVKAGQAVPPLSQWADLSTLTAPQVEEQTTVPVKNNPTKGTTDRPAKTDNKNTSTNTNTTNNEKKEVEAASVLPGATPKAGKWLAVVSNGYKGDKLTFTVSADGKRVENVEFIGNWRSRSSRTEVLINLDPPNPFGVSKGNFSAVQRVEKSRMWWEFIGRFTTATSAEGSYRCAFAGGEYDTYKLKWTAKYVGSN